MLLSPLVLLLAGLLLLGMAARRRQRRLRLLAIGCVLAALLAMTPLVANGLVFAVERQARAGDGACDGIEAVVFLSGGVDQAPASASDLAALTADSVSRVFALARRELEPALPLVVSGGGPFNVAEADVIVTLMRGLGIGSEQVLLESRSGSTWESAVAVAQLLPGVQRIALASSALHLPRAMLVFRAAGFEVCPWPLQSRWQAPRGAWSLLPQSSGLGKTEAALHEMVGMLWYRWRLFAERGGGERAQAAARAARVRAGSSSA